MAWDYNRHLSDGDFFPLSLSAHTDHSTGHYYVGALMYTSLRMSVIIVQMCEYSLNITTIMSGPGCVGAALFFSSQVHVLDLMISRIPDEYVTHRCKRIVY